MYYFGRWNVLEEPALGTATLTLWVSADGGALGPAYHDTTSPYGGFEERCIRFSVRANPWHRSGIRPYACEVLVGSKRDGVAGGADPNNPERYEEVVIAITGDVDLDRSDYNRKVAPSVTGPGPAQPHLRLKVIRILDKSTLPDLGEPIYLPELLPSEQWSVIDAVIGDWSSERADRPASQFTLVSPDEEWLRMAFPDGFMPTYLGLREALGESLYDEVRVIRGDQSIEFLSPVDRTTWMSTGRAVRWRVRLSWSDAERAAFAWDWESPYNYTNARERPQARLRLAISANIVERLVYEVYHAGRPVDEFGNTIDDIEDPLRCIDYDAMRVEVNVIERNERHPETRLASDEPFRVNVPRRSFDQWQDQLGHDLRASARRDPTILFGLPLLLLTGPSLPLALSLGVALSLGSVYCSMAERALVARQGYDSAGQPQTQEELDVDLRMAIIGVLLNVGPVGAAATAAVSRALRRVAQQGSTLRRSVASMRTPVRLLLGMADRKAVERTLEATARKVLVPDEVLLPGELSVTKRFTSLRRFHEDLIVATIRRPQPVGAPSLKYLLNEVAMGSIFKPDGTGFKIFALDSLYRAYVSAIRADFELIEAGMDVARSTGRLALDPASWLLRSSGPTARKSKAIAALLGPDWRDKVRAYRDVLPLRDDVLAIYGNFPKGTMSYEQAQFLRNQLVPEVLKRIALNPDVQHHIAYPKLWELVRTANRKSFGSMFELEHPFERRCIKTFASPIDPEAREILNYETEARVILVPKTRGVARHIPDFAGYVHWEKSRMTEALIPYGKERQYSLQQMRDAHVFVISALEGHNSRAIEMIDEAVAIISRRTQSPVEFTSSRSASFRAQFQSGAWNYYPPSEDIAVAMSNEQYLRQRFLIDDALARDPGLTPVPRNLEPVPATTDNVEP